MSARLFDGVNKFLAEYDFRMNENILDKVKCLKCGKILINACQVPCGCRYCRVCIDGLLESGCRVCPGNTEECNESNLSDMQIDYRVQKTISKLIVKCPKEICSFECELINMNEHLRVCSTKGLKCIFYGLGCDQSNVTAAKMNEHLQLASYSHMEILMGIIDNMRNEIDRLKESDERNRNEIDRLRENCDGNKNGIYLLKETGERNVNEIDRLKESDQRNKKEIYRLKESDERNNNEIDRLMKSDERYKNGIDRLRENCDKNKNGIDRLTENCDRNKNGIHLLKETGEKNVNEIDQLKESNERNKNEIDRLKKRDERNKNDIAMLKRNKVRTAERIKSWEKEIKLMKEEKIDNLEREIGKTAAKLGAGLSEMRQEWIDALDINEAVLKETNERYQTDMETRMSAAEKWMDKLIDGIFVWTIDNVAQRRRNKEFISSGYFCSKIEPYKMTLKMLVNGGGPVTGTGLSIYLLIYSDVRDKWLDWSLPVDVSIRIVNKANPNAYKIITKRYTNRMPDKNLCYRLSNDCDFDFLYADLCDASLLIGDCFIVECRCDVRLDE